MGNLQGRIIRVFLGGTAENLCKPADSLLMGYVHKVAIAKDIETYQQFIAFVHDLGAKVMIKRFDAQSLSPDAIKQLRPDYIRLSRDICDSVADDKEKKAFIELIQEMSSLLNIKVLWFFRTVCHR